MCAIESSPPRLRHVEELYAISSALVLDPAPFVTCCRRRTVANGDSITFDVRRCFQCSAGKSKNVSSTSVSFSRAGIVVVDGVQSEGKANKTRSRAA